MLAQTGDNSDDNWSLNDAYTPDADSQKASSSTQAPCEVINRRRDVQIEIRDHYMSYKDGTRHFNFYDIKELYTQLNEIDYLCNKTTLCSQVPRMFLRNMVEGIIVPIGENPINAMVNPLL